MDRSTDENSVYAQVNKVQPDKDGLFWDVLGYMFGGFETSTKTNQTLFFYLAKYPEIRRKLLKEIQDYVV